MFDFEPQFFWLAFRGVTSNYNYLYNFSLFIYIKGMKAMSRLNTSRATGLNGVYSTSNSTPNTDINGCFMFINKEGLNISYYSETTNAVNANKREEFYLCLG